LAVRGRGGGLQLRGWVGLAGLFEETWVKYDVTLREIAPRVIDAHLQHTASCHSELSQIAYGGIDGEAWDADFTAGDGSIMDEFSKTLDKIDGKLLDRLGTKMETVFVLAQCLQSFALCCRFVLVGRA
jgi:hypothetical protein